MTRILNLALVALLLATTEAGATRPTKGRAIRTGQTQSYGADGDTTAGLTFMLKDLGNGVVKDQRTGLFWEKKSDDGSIHDKDNSYTWSVGIAPFQSTASGTAFTVFLATLNTPPCFAGHCDWRLPTVKELGTIVDFGSGGPGVPQEFDNDCSPGCTVASCSCTGIGRTWSSTTYYYNSTYAWYVFFYFGNAERDVEKSGTALVRAVRSGS